MNEQVITFCFNNVGALSADYVWYARLPYSLTLQSVSAVGSNATNATIAVGNSSDAAAYMTAQAVGQSGTPARYTRANFVGGSAHVPKDTVLKVTVDYDGAGGTAVQNLQVVITALVGA